MALDINSVGEAENAAYFSGAYAYTVKVNGGSNTVNGGSRIEGGAWEFVIGDIYNKSGNTSLYRAGTHNIMVKYTLPESVKANYNDNATEKTVGVALRVNQGALHITILPEQMIFGTPYSLGAVRDVDYTIEGFVAGDDGNLTGVAFKLINGTDNGFDAEDDTLNAVGTYKGVIDLSSYSSYNNNYTVEYTRGNVVISKLPVTVTPNEGQSKYYGESDPVFTYTATKTAALKADYSIDYDEFSGEVTRNGGETAGTYAYVNELTSTNYDITFVRGNSVFEIYKLPVTVVPENYFAYYGEAIPAPSEYDAVIDRKAYKVTYTLENGVLTVSGMENVLSITFNTLASQNASAGEYPITITQASSSANGAQNLDLSLDQIGVAPARVVITEGAVLAVEGRDVGGVSRVDEGRIEREERGRAVDDRQVVEGREAQGRFAVQPRDLGIFVEGEIFLRVDVQVVDDADAVEVRVVAEHRADAYDARNRDGRRADERALSRLFPRQEPRGGDKKQGGGKDEGGEIHLPVQQHEQDEVEHEQSEAGGSYGEEFEDELQNCLSDFCHTFSFCLFYHMRRRTSIRSRET